MVREHVQMRKVPYTYARHYPDAAETEQIRLEVERGDSKKEVAARHRLSPWRLSRLLQGKLRVPAALAEGGAPAEAPPEEDAADAAPAEAPCVGHYQYTQVVRYVNRHGRVREHTVTNRVPYVYKRHYPDEAETAQIRLEIEHGEPQKVVAARHRLTPVRLRRLLQGRMRVPDALATARAAAGDRG